MFKVLAAVLHSMGSICSGSSQRVVPSGELRADVKLNQHLFLKANLSSKGSINSMGNWR